PYFARAYVDIDESRAHPLQHRYVHGGFKGTDTRFSFYFPPAGQWKGRFLHMLEGGMGGDENSLSTGLMSAIAIGHPAFTLAFEDVGAYLVESNQGHLGNDMSGVQVSGEEGILEHRASAASAEYARELAAEMYGRAPHHGYVWGGSGGGHRTVVCFE